MSAYRVRVQGDRRSETAVRSLNMLPTNEGAIEAVSESRSAEGNVRACSRGAKFVSLSPLGPAKLGTDERRRPGTPGREALLPIVGGSMS